MPLPTRKFWPPHITKTRGIAESGGESMWADSPETVHGEFRDVGIDWNIDKGSTAGHISIPLSYALHTLPPDVLLAICMYLDARSLVCFAYVCKYFYNLAQKSSLSLNLDKLLSVFVSSVSGFKRQLLLSGLAVYGWDISVSSCIGEQPPCQVICRTLGDSYDIAVYLVKFEEYSSEFSFATASFHNGNLVGPTMDFRSGHLFRMVKAAFQTGIPFELERDDGVTVLN